MKAYDFSYNYNSKFILSLFILLILIIMSIVSVCNSNKKIFKLIIVAIFILLSLMVCYTSYFYPYSKYKEIKEAINNNEILYVSGEVVDLYTPKLKFGSHECESFKINDIEFKYYENESYGYSVFANNNGIIFENGQKLKIGYYEEYEHYDKSSPSRRVIVSIEILEDK